MSFFLHMHRFHKRYIANLTTLLVPYGLSTSNWSLLHYVARHDKTTISHIAKYWDVEKPTVSANVKTLMQMGLLRAEPGEDKREKYLLLTEAGHALHVEICPLIEQFKAQLLQAFPSEQLPLFEQALLAMERILKGEQS